MSTHHVSPARRLLRRIGLGFALAVSALTTHAQTAATALELKVINHGANSFYVNSVLVQGAKEAVLLDAGFTRADALRVAAAVLDSGKKLTTIYVSAADPDYYFGLEVLRQEFPEAKIVAAAPTLAMIEALLPTKLKTWGPRMGVNAPRKPVLPEAMSGSTLSLEGQSIEVRGLDDSMPHRSYVWIPSIKTVLGGTNILASGMHVWTADTQTVAERQAWVAKLDKIAALQPAIVIPGHNLPGVAQDLSTVRYTQQYLGRFETELAKAKDSAALIGAMKAAYPEAGAGSMSLEIGAKVNKGEMKW